MIQAAIQEPETIKRIDVIKDGKYVFITRPDSRTATVRYVDNDIKPGKCYYYPRAFQRDTENPDGDPEIGWASPFYVTYR